MLWGASVMGAGQAWQSHCRQAVPPWSTQTDWRTLPVLCVCVSCVYVRRRCAWSPRKAGQIQRQLLGVLLMMIWRTIITSDSSRCQKKVVHATHLEKHPVQTWSEQDATGRGTVSLFGVFDTGVCAWAHTCSASVCAQRVNCGVLCLGLWCNRIL